jgi:hypothetical protein
LAGTPNILREDAPNGQIREQCVEFLDGSDDSSSEISDDERASDGELWEMLQVSIMKEWMDSEGVLYLVPATTLASWPEFKKSTKSYLYVIQFLLTPSLRFALG